MVHSQTLYKFIHKKEIEVTKPQFLKNLQRVYIRDPLILSGYVGVLKVLRVERVLRAMTSGYHNQRAVMLILTITRHHTFQEDIEPFRTQKQVLNKDGVRISCSTSANIGF